MSSRQRNRQWTIPDEPTLEYATFGVLMDIRDELRDLNRLLTCKNFTGIPETLRAIKKNTKAKATEPRP